MRRRVKKKKKKKTMMKKMKVKQMPWSSSLVLDLLSLPLLEDAAAMQSRRFLSHSFPNTPRDTTTVAAPPLLKPPGSSWSSSLVLHHLSVPLLLPWASSLVLDHLSLPLLEGAAAMQSRRFLSHPVLNIPRDTTTIAAPPLLKLPGPSWSGSLVPVLDHFPIPLLEGAEVMHRSFSCPARDAPVAVPPGQASGMHA